MSDFPVSWDATIHLGKSHLIQVASDHKDILPPFLRLSPLEIIYDSSPHLVLILRWLWNLRSLATTVRKERRENLSGWLSGCSFQSISCLPEYRLSCKWWTTRLVEWEEHFSYDQRLRGNGTAHGIFGEKWAGVVGKEVQRVVADMGNKIRNEIRNRFYRLGKGRPRHLDPAL